MRRTMGLLLAAGLVAGLLSASEAQACHKKKCATPCVEVAVCPAPCPAPAPVCVPVCAPAPVCEPVCPPAPVCETPKKKCGLFGGGGGLFKGLCHKKKAVECAPVAVATCAAPMTYVYAAPVTYAAPIYAAPQSYPAAQQ